MGRTDAWEILEVFEEIRVVEVLVFEAVEREATGFFAAFFVKWDHEGWGSHG